MISIYCLNLIVNAYQIAWGVRVDDTLAVGLGFALAIINGICLRKAKND